jgi:hypothetical protein
VGITEGQLLERRKHRVQLGQRRQVGCSKALVPPLDPRRLAQLPAVPHAHLDAQRRGLLVISPQLLLRGRRQQRPQLFAGAAEVHDEARLERVAQLAQDDALLVAAQLRERYPRHACALCGGAPSANHGGGALCWRAGEHAVRASQKTRSL